ncbi:MAG: MFS transporter [Candidatus Binatia bacterium]
MQTTHDQVPLTTKLFFGVGAMAEGIKNSVFNVFLLFYYNQVLGVSGTLTGAAIFVALCVDAITDPLVGSLSDGFRSRWGRRHPFMYSAGVPMAVCFTLLFNPPSGLSQTGLFVWLTTWAIGVRTAMTLYTVPSSAMMPEITSHYDERTSLVSYRYLFGLIGAVLIAQVGYLYFFAPSAQFADGRLDPDAYGKFALVGSVILLFAILVSSLGTHHLIPSLRFPQDNEPFSFRRLIGEIRSVLSNYSYAMLFVAALFGSITDGFQEVVALYIGTYFWGFSTKQLSVLTYAYMLATLIAFAFARPITLRFDKKRTVLGLAIFFVVVGPLPIFLRLLDLMPDNGTPLLLFLIFLHLLAVIAVAIIIRIVVASMIADIVDEHELTTGKRQEGLFFSAVTFADKATSGVGGLIAGVALDLIAFPKGVAVGAVPPETIFKLGLVVGPGLMLLRFLSLMFVARYRITRESHQQILTQLRQRQQPQETA